MNDEDRLSAIEERVRALGGHAWWNEEYNDLELKFCDVELVFTMTDASIKAAGRLLATYEDGPEIEIKQHEDGTECSPDCPLLLKNVTGMKDNCPRCVFSERHTDSDRGGMWWFDSPGPNCPAVKYGVKKFKLMPVTGG